MHTKFNIEVSGFQNKEMKNKVVSLLPLINNMLIFRTDKDSNHGFPDKLLCPDNIYRKSIALYYYVEEKRILPIQLKKRKHHKKHGHKVVHH